MRPHSLFDDDDFDAIVASIDVDEVVARASQELPSSQEPPRTSQPPPLLPSAAAPPPSGLMPCPPTGATTSAHTKENHGTARGNAIVLE